VSAIANVWAMILCSVLMREQIPKMLCIYTCT